MSFRRSPCRKAEDQQDERDPEPGVNEPGLLLPPRRRYSGPDDRLACHTDLLLGQRPLPFFIDSALLSVCCAVVTDLDHTFSGLSRAHLARLGSYFGQSCDRLRLHRTKAVSFVRPTRCIARVCYR